MQTFWAFAALTAALAALGGAAGAACWLAGRPRRKGGPDASRP